MNSRHAPRAPASRGPAPPGWIGVHVRRLRRDHLRRDDGRHDRRRPDGRVPGPPRSGRPGLVELRPGGLRAPPAVGHRPHPARRPADGGQRPRPDRRLQRLHLRLPRAAGRAGGRRPPVLLHQRHRGDPQGLRPVGHRRRLAPARHVRLRDPRAGHRPGGPGPRPAGHQAALPRRDAGPAAVRLHAARAAARGRRRHLHRPGRAAPLPDLARRRPGAADAAQRRPEAAARDRAGDRGRRQQHRAPVLGAPLRAPSRALGLVGPRLGGRRSRRRCGSPSAAGSWPTPPSGCCSPAAWTPA